MAEHLVELRWQGSRVIGPTERPLRISASSSRHADRHDIRLTIECVADSSVRAAIRFVLPLPDRTGQPWWLIPGAFYGENRPAANSRTFPRFAIGADDPAGMVSDHWEFRADRAATPAVFGWTKSGGAALVADETTPLGMTGLGFGHDASSGQASLWLRFPFAETPVSYYGSGRPNPPQRHCHTWQPGERTVLDIAIYALPADRHAYAPVLREQHQRLSAAAPLHPWVSPEQAAELAAHGLLRWHYDPDPGVLLETVGFDREITGQDGKPVDRQAMHVGWVSGIPWAYALLRHGIRTGDEAPTAAARRIIDFCCADRSPSGTFWGVWYRDKGWTQSWSAVRHSLHSRTLGEATVFLLRALRLSPANSAWMDAARGNLDAVIARQRADGNLGSAHHALTGQVLSWSGSAGLAWVNALAEAGALDEDGRYLAAAQRAGEYYASFVTDEFPHGAPEDVDLAPTSEDGYVALMAYAALYRRTGRADWLDLARRSADWLLTFRYSYNTAFAPGTPLHAYGFASRGADTASPSNQHLHAYGLVCTAELAELSAASGDPYYVERAREALACFRQFVARFDGDFNAYRGMVTERYYQTACFQPKGMLLTLSHAWSAGVLLLGCEQALADPALAMPCGVV
jgi:hypothetical protein